jgi:glycosyltransferase involved in cell wall biosynthesis
LRVGTVLCWGTYDTGKPRTRILHDGLRSVGLSVHECHEPVWEGIEDKTEVRGRVRRLVLLAHWVSRYPVLMWRFLLLKRPDLVLIGYPGVLDMLVLAPIARMRRVPVAWDMFMSLYDTIVQDRALVKPGTWRARLLRKIESHAVRCADLVFLDTEAHARHVEALLGLPIGHCDSVWVGAEVERFRLDPPDPAAIVNRSDARLSVLFYGQFVPLHGIDTIIAAAQLMQEEPVDWLIIGRGQDAPRIRLLLQASPVPRLRWIEWVEYTELRNWIARSDICLGIFGDSEKAASVIPNKVFQIVASGRPLITRDSPAIRELLEHSPPCVYLVGPSNPAELAAALRLHLRLQRESPPTQCHVGRIRRINARAVGEQFVEMLSRRS